MQTCIQKTNKSYRLNHALEEAKQNMYNDIVEYMIFAIDSYEDEVHEMDTDDPFYGLYEEMENLDNE